MIWYLQLATWCQPWYYIVRQKATIVEFMLLLFKNRFFRHSQEAPLFNRNPSTRCHLAHNFFPWISYRASHLVRLWTRGTKSDQISNRLSHTMGLLSAGTYWTCNVWSVLFDMSCREAVGGPGKAPARLARATCRSRIDSWSWEEQSRWLISTHCANGSEISAKTPCIWMCCCFPWLSFMCPKTWRI